MVSESINVANSISQQRRRWVKLAWYTILVVSLSLVVTAIPGYVETFINGSIIEGLTPSPSPLVTGINVASGFFSLSSTLLSIILAIMLFRRRPNERMALFLSFYLLLFGLYSAPLGGKDPVGSGTWTRFAVDVVFTQLVMYPASCFLFLLFPNGRFEPSWSRKLALVVLISVPISLAENYYVWVNSGALQSWQLALGSVPQVAVTLAILYAMIYRFRHNSSVQERLQIKWLMYGFGLMLFLLLVSGAPYFWMFTLPEGSPLPALGAFSVTIYYASFAVLPLSLTIAVMRHRLYDIDIIINRTLVYGALSALVVGIYVVIVGSMSLLFQTRNNILISLLVTGLVAVLFQSMREWMQAKVDKYFFGEKDNPVQVLARLGEQIEANVPLGVLLTGLLETISNSLKLPYAAVELISNNSSITAVEYGQPLAATERLPLVTHGEHIGELVVSPRGSNRGFKDEERLLLENIARQTAAAVYAGRLYSDLQKSRQQIVTAREEERRRLRRDLHDGIGPTMASQTLRLDAAIDLISANNLEGSEKDLAKATRLLLDMKQQNQESVREIRRIVYALRPPALDDLGLIPAIGAHVDQQIRALDRPRVVINTPPDGLPPLPAAVEIVIYRVIQEAFTNVIRHAEAKTCEISLSVSKDSPGEVLVQITDDGRGFADNGQPGVGLTAMRERTEEVGGRFRVESSVGQGARLKASIPLQES